MNQEILYTCCAVCNQQTHRRCSRCLSIYYCNQDHQRQDWRRHKVECAPKLPKQEFNKKSDITVNNKQNLISEDKKSQIGLNNSQISESEVNRIVSNEIRKIVKPKKKAANKVESAVSGTNTSHTVTENITAIQNNISASASDISNPVSTSNESSNFISRVTFSIKDKQSAITSEGSSEQKILSEPAQQLSAMNSNVQVANRINARMPGLPVPGHEALNRTREYSEAVLRNNNSLGPENLITDPSDPDYEVCQRLITHMNQFGVCAMKNFYGRERGLRVLNEVLEMYKLGIFTAGEVVSNPGSNKTQNIRSDLITWIDGSEPQCYNISLLMKHIDRIVMSANKMVNNGKMGDYVIKERTKAMVACYPGSGSHYVQHVDNPHKDGRCITAIYYLNLDWDVEKSGGLLRVFPEGFENYVCNVEPKFDQMLFFWSDRRNPHEVQPAHDTRYAITLWYFDQKERAEAVKRYRERHQQPSTTK